MSAAPHAFRAVGGRVLAVSEPGHWAFLTEAEHAALLAGLAPAHPRFAELAAKGFVAEAMDFDRLAADALEHSLLSWEGARRHVLVVQRGRRRMSAATARRAVDFAFTVPGPAVVLELACEDAEAAWPLARFVARYAARRAEWNGRRARVWLRAPAVPAPRLAALASEGLGLALELSPRTRLPSVPPGLRARAVLAWTPAFKDGAAWARRLRAAGFGSALVSPDAPERLADVPAFARFYAAFLDEALAGKAALREEWAAAALRRLPSAEGRPREERGGPLPGQDLLGELCVTPEGELLAAERALSLPADDAGLWSLGGVGATAWDELAAKDNARTFLAASLGDHHPLCAQCVYKQACAVPPSVSQAVQGSFWGHLPASPACRARLALLDAVFARLAREQTREALLAWAERWTLL